MMIGVPFAFMLLFYVTLAIAYRKRVDRIKQDSRKHHGGGFWVDIVEEYTSGRVQWVAGNQSGVICSGYCEESRYPLAAIDATKAELERRKRIIKEQAFQESVDQFITKKNLDI